MIAFAWIVGIVLVLLALALGGLALFSAWTARQVEKRLPPHGRFIEVDGARIHYLDEGSGPKLLLIHGLAGQTRVFTHSLLDRLKRDYRVVILDRPGSGYSTRPSRASAAIGAQAHTIARFIEALGLERPLVVGHSLGGAIALASRDLMATMEDLAHMQERYQRLTIPIGVLFGTGDRLLDPAKHGAAMATKVAGLDLELIEGGGHMVPISSADRAVTLIARMAQRVAADAGRALTT
jgi:pimeloyl-ACP methyl ester carboxylesterase